MTELNKSIPLLKSRLKTRALSEGFDSIQFTNPDQIPDLTEPLQKFLEQGYHGDMAWMEKHQIRRQNPINLWAETNSIIVLGLNYGSGVNPLKNLQQKEKGNISIYARGDDYHDIIKKKLKKLSHWIIQETQEKVKYFVDTAPLMEKPLAATSGMGWQGKHTNLVSRKFGSWLFIGSLFTTAHFPIDYPEKNHCGSCQACLDICPTNAFPKPYEIDARRCISYLTIETKKQIPREFRSLMGNRIYGCDDCLAICPWNKYAQISQEIKLKERPEINNQKLIELVQLDDVKFRALFKKSPIKRTGRHRFVRNVLIALGNANNADLLPYIEARLTDESPLVRGMAIWAMAQYKSSNEIQHHASLHLPEEHDEDTREEWQYHL